MLDELQKRSEQAVELARKAGAQDAFASVYRARTVSFSMRENKLEEVKDSTSRGLSVKVFVDGRFSSNSTTDLRPEMLESFVAEAVALTRALQPDKHRTLPDPALYRGQPGRLDLVDGRVASMDRETRLGLCQTMNSRVTGKSGVISATSSVSDGHVHVAAASSNGFSGSYEMTSMGAYTSVTMKDGDKRPSDWMGARGRHATEVLAPEVIADTALERTKMLLGTGKGKTQRTTVVVENRAGGRLIGRLLGPLSGRAIQQQRSFFRDRLGQKLMADGLSIIDDPTLPRGLGSRPFDGEGMAARKRSIVEAGVLKNYYLSTYYANKLGTAPTTGDGSNLIVAPGQKSLEQLLADVGNGIYVTSWLGGNMDSTTGDFSIGVRGRVIENGALGAPVAEMNATGNMLELFSQLQKHLPVMPANVS